MTLYANGKPTDKTLELSSSNRWSGAFEGLAKRSADGKEIDYTIKETLVDYYESEIVGSASDGFTITNSHQLLYTSRTVNKIWDDGNDVDGLRAPLLSISCKTESNIERKSSTMLMTGMRRSINCPLGTALA